MTTTNTYKKYQVLIFDWDGTLIDSLGHIIDSSARVAAHFGLKKPETDEIREAIGLPTMDYVARVFPQADNYEEIKDYYINDYVQTDKAEKLFNGAHDTLLNLFSQGYKLAIATNKASSSLQYSLKRHNIQDLFVTLRCGDDEFTKPQPEVIWSILSELQLSHNEALMIGDTEFDMQVAANAKIDALAVGYGVRSRKQLLSYEPIGCIDRVQELLQILS